MGFGSIGGFNPNLNAYGAGKVKKPAEGEQQGETKAPELNMVDTKGSETKINVALNGLDALAAQGRANIGAPKVAVGGTDAPVVTKGEQGAHYNFKVNPKQPGKVMTEILDEIWKDRTGEGKGKYNIGDTFTLTYRDGVVENYRVNEFWELEKI